MRSKIRHDCKLCTRASYLAKNENRGMAFGLGDKVISAIYHKEDRERDSFTWWGGYICIFNVYFDFCRA